MSSAPNPTPTILITGATGSQGGATAHALLSQAIPIHALVRDPSTPAALALQRAGATLFPGTYDSLPALTAASQGCTGVFINTMPTAGAAPELHHAQNIIAAARAAGTVSHLIYSSVQLTDQHGSLPDLDPRGFMAGYWAAKHGIEEMVRRSGLRWTILRPAFFMKNLVPPQADFMFPELGPQGVWLTAYGPDTRLTLVAEGDVGAFAARAFLHPEAFGGREITLGVQTLGLQEIARCLSEAVGKEIQVKLRTEEEVEALKGVNPIIESQVLSRKLNFEMDFEELRKYGIKLTTFKEYLEARKDDLRKGYTF